MVDWNWCLLGGAKGDEERNVNLAKFKPIKHGWLKAMGVTLIGFVAPILAMGACYLIPKGAQTIAANLDNTGAPVWMPTVVIVVGMVILLILEGALIIMTTRKIMPKAYSWLQKYWRRGIDGNYVATWLNENDQERDVVCPRGQLAKSLYSLPLSQVKSPIIVYPLGGWRWPWRRPTGKLYPDLQSLERELNGLPNLEGWALTRCGSAIDDVSRQDFALKDITGRKIIADANTLLRFVTGRDEWPQVYFNPVRKLLLDIARLRRERDIALSGFEASEARRKELAIRTEQMEGLRDVLESELIQVLDETIRRLDETKRFIKSKQAKEIRSWLVGVLLNHLPAEHPLRTQYELKAAPTGQDGSSKELK